MSEWREDLYLGEGGWTSQRSESAQLRLRALLRDVPAHTEARNELLARDGESWRSLSAEEESALGALQRGWIWRRWPQRLGERELVGFRGLRFVDSQIAAQLLSGLELLHRDTGEPLDSPQAAGRAFLLRADHAEEFERRVSSQGGEIQPASSWMEESERMLSEATKLLAEIERSLAEDLRVLEEMESGDLTGQLEFDARGERLTHLSSRARALAHELEERMRVSRQNSYQRAQALRVARAARAIGAQIEELRAGRARAERLVARRIEAAEGGAQTQAPVSEISLKLLLRDLSDLWDREGVPHRESAQGLVVRVGEREVWIGRTAREWEEPQGRSERESQSARAWPDDDEL